MTDRKKPGVAFWATVGVVVVVLYVASLGPACSLSSRSGIGNELPSVIYRPILMLMKIDDSPADLRQRLTPTDPSDYGGWVTLYFYPKGVVSHYASWLATENWCWRFRQAFEFQPDPIVRSDEGDWEWCDGSVQRMRMGVSNGPFGAYCNYVNATVAAPCCTMTCACSFAKTDSRGIASNRRPRSVSRLPY